MPNVCASFPCFTQMAICTCCMLCMFYFYHVSIPYTLGISMYLCSHVVMLVMLCMFYFCRDVTHILCTYVLFMVLLCVCSLNVWIYGCVTCASFPCFSQMAIKSYHMFCTTCYAYILRILSVYPCIWYEYLSSYHSHTDVALFFSWSCTTYYAYIPWILIHTTCTFIICCWTFLHA